VEASSYLHVGHLKELFINYLYAQKYNGKMILRFDDTDPKVKKPIIRKKPKKITY
jgi:glutamyl/glutaminyl-tRNA synthetase